MIVLAWGLATLAGLGVVAVESTGVDGISSGALIVTALTGYGPLGVFVVLSYMGKVHSDKAVQERVGAEAARADKAEDRADKAETALDAYRDRTEREVIPLLTRAVDAMTTLMRGGGAHGADSGT